MSGSGGEGGRGRARGGGGGGGSEGGRGRTRGGGGGAAGRGGYNFASIQPSPWRSHEMEQRLTVEASSSTAAAQAHLQRQRPRAVAVNPPLVQPELAPKSSKAVRFPPRPGFGRVGRRVLVKANHFLAEVAERDLHHYDVSISPEVASKAVCREIMNELVATYKDSHLGKKTLAYDGRNSCYAAGKLPFQSNIFSIILVDSDNQSRREREFMVSIKYASKPDFYHLKQYIEGGRQLDLPQDTLQLFDVVLREKPSKRLGDPGELGNGLIYWKGFYQSLRPTQMGLSLNINMSARAFFEPIPVVDYVVKYINGYATRRGLSDHQDRIKVKRALKGVKVETQHLGSIRRYKISGITTQSTQELMFPLAGTGDQISVEEYFRQKYDVKLRYPSLPAVQAGSDTKPTYLPMELCRIVEGQRYSRRLNQGQVTALLKATCQRPHDRENSIIKMVDHNNYNQYELVHAEFGISIRPEMTSIEARVLPAPKLRYHASGRDSLVTPSVGQWNMMDKKMVNGGKVEFWACINFSSKMTKEDAERFCNDLIDMCCRKGMECRQEAVVVRDARGRVEEALFNVEAETRRKINDPRKRLQLLIVILPDTSGSYGTIKRVCETELGIVSQCCLQKNLTRPRGQLTRYMENVALKINAKVGGRNNVLDQALRRSFPYLTECPTMIFGADVTHPHPGKDSSPSIAAVVASMDWPEVTKYRALVSAQAHREEIIQDLYNMTREHLLLFNKATKSRPERIIFYRDGVSEGQFSQVLLHEMEVIRKACESIQKNYMPRVTFIVLQKRHHTRLFAANHRDRSSTDRSGNVLPGTVVDTKICHPTEFDFYLCSHAGIQGTSRPTHYHVLYDENDFSADGLQMLTNSLCYMYARSTRSVSVVPPAYYAHLAAFRARYYIEGNDLSDSGSTSDAGRGKRNREVRPLPVIKNSVKDVMFYI